jgi:hypothetical protein
MTQLCTCAIQMVVLGPFLTAATGPDKYGVDKSAHRDYKERLVIPSSHLKGKLRSSLEELALFFDAEDSIDLDTLLGKESAEGSYEPLPATVRFSDLVSDSLAIEGARTRITINHVSQTAQQNMLREIENPFASGAEIHFTGDVTFSAPDLSSAIRIAGMIQVGLQWLATIGAEKGVGFGRLKSAKVSAPAETHAPTIPAFRGGLSALHLKISAQEPLLSGGIKSRRSNFVVSRIELSGGMIKGALAAAMNEACGVTPVTRPLDSNCAADFPGFEALVRNFSAIRITHARPAIVGNPRPTRLPLSAVESEGLIGDVALSKEKIPLMPDSKSPSYYGDAKNLGSFKGLADPAELFVTRSEINDESQCTAKGQLFTYQFYAPRTDQGLPIEWICNVNFDAIPGIEDRKAACQQFAAAVQKHLQRLGKLKRAVTVTVSEGLADPAIGSCALIQDGLALITLQSDAIMLDPATSRSLSLGQNLYEAYTAYWHDLSGGALELDDFFAHQGFEGGYLYHRYLGAAERTHSPNRYRPYYLTLAGSLFKLKVKDEPRATELLNRWLANGLPLPRWALDEYGQKDMAIWRTCPFVPENGYGEVAVNLSWHWQKRI